MYFNSFRPAGRVIDAQCNTRSVVERAMRLREKYVAEGEDFDHVWCVFDHDGVPDARIRDTFELAASEGIEIAFSNLAFEVWFLLHDRFLTSALSNEQLCEKLAELHGTYEKTDAHFSEQLRGKTGVAIRNAKRLLREYQRWDPVSSDPSTTVFRLVEKLIDRAAK